MKETKNLVTVAGVLVKKDFALGTNENGDFIRGSLLIRTLDGSEHEVKYFSKRLKKDNTPNGIYKSLLTVMNEYKTLETHPTEPDLTSITSGNFKINDYKGKDGEMKNYVEIQSNFANRLTTQKDIETTLQESFFEVEGIITSVKPEVIKEIGTGNMILTMEIIGYENNITPIKLTVPQPLVDGFNSTGYVEGALATLSGKLVNTKDTQEVIESVAFGQPVKKLVTTTVKRLEVTGGQTPKFGEIDEEELKQARGKRKLMLDAKQSEVKTPSANQGNGFVQPPVGATPTSNPFATNTQNTNTQPPISNPFATQQ